MWVLEDCYFYLLETKGMNVTQKTAHFILAKSYVVKRRPIQNPGTTFLSIWVTIWTSASLDYNLFSLALPQSVALFDQNNARLVQHSLSEIMGRWERKMRREM